MSAIGLIVVFSGAMAAALWLVVTGWSQPRPSLARTVRHLRSSPPIIADPVPVAAGPAPPRPVLARLGAALLGRAMVGGHRSAGTGAPAWSVEARIAAWRRPLRLVGRTVAEHVGLLITAAAVGFLAPALLLATLQAAGAVALGVWIPIGVSLIGAVAAPSVIHADTLAHAHARRVDVRHQLSAYLDMVTMLLAGNTGHEGALEQAARGGDGLLFKELRRRMREVATVGNSLVGALALVGEDLGVVELEQVAATAALSATEGAPVARTLSAKCSTLRSSLAAEQEAAARVRTDKVTPPLVGMAVLFMALIIYPALALN